MTKTTKVAIALVHVPWVALAVAGFALFMTWHHLADGAPQASMARDIELAFYTGNVAAVLFAIGVRLHLRESRRVAKPRPWVWRQVRLCSLGLVPLLPVLWPVGVIAILAGVSATARLKEANTETLAGLDGKPRQQAIPLGRDKQ